MSSQGGDGRTYSDVWPGGQAARKPLLRPFRPATAPGGPAKTSDIWQRFLKPHGVGLVVRGTSDMALGTKKRETRKSLQQSGWITMEGGFASPVRGARHVHDRCQGNDRRSQHPAGQIAAGLFT